MGLLLHLRFYHEREEMLQSGRLDLLTDLRRITAEELTQDERLLQLCSRDLRKTPRLEDSTTEQPGGLESRAGAGRQVSDASQCLSEA